MAEIFAGKWKLDRSENFDDYLKELGKFTTLFKFKQEKQRKWRIRWWKFRHVARHWQVQASILVSPMSVSAKKSHKFNYGR